MEQSFIYIGRQPILDKNKKIVAYEILYRKNIEAFARIEDENQATSRVIVNIFNNIGLKNLTGNKKTFINVNAELLFHRIFDFVHPENLIIEVLENTPAEERFLQRIIQLKKRGFHFALDDFVETEDTQKLLPYVDYVKIDLLQINESYLPRLVKKLKDIGKIVIAEKVESYDIFRKIFPMGFDMYQGYFFARPSVISHRRFDPYEMTLLNLLKTLNRGNASIDEVENIIKSDVHITFNLLKFVNSAYFSFHSRIKTIKHAIMILGIEKLKVWVLLMLYADAKIGGIDSPLLELALIRGKVMESMAKIINHGKNFPDMAFLTGVLSLIDILLGLPKEEVLSDLNIDEEIKRALLEEKGTLGEMIKLCEYLEAGDFVSLKNELKELGIRIDDFFKAEEQAVLYVEEIKQKILQRR
ncbi:HDOD domain-containing protein [Persephonella atlantica]|uniref:HDOD domain-containing protein n=1 Tax=Persephonella atlantica TaxID=2699429 RepID=A0ABS1GIT4_9AQUI|nr:HDOD domain-containing protein [Persephonella atlantica]MBK3332833.1 HDOD domain-containing protein [Persephonella atlantica]